MASEIPFKRRRLDESYRKLSKPFVSPLKLSKVNEDSPCQTGSGTNDRRATIDAETPAPRLNERRTSPKTASRHGYQSSGLRRNQHDPAIVAARKAVTSIEHQIRSARSDIDALTQAAQITGSSYIDSNLSRLTQKWKLASHAAADDVFEIVKEQVNAMGGVAAWRESEKRKHNREAAFDEQKPEDGKSPSDDLDDSNEETMPQEHDEERHEDEANTFTMDMMLQSLNIELEVIGYDKAVEGWIA